MQRGRKGTATVQGMQLLAEQRCTPFAEALRGVTTTATSVVNMEPCTVLHVHPEVDDGADTIEAGLARLFAKDTLECGSGHQTLLLELPEVRRE